jgi:hypothetical protein
MVSNFLFFSSKKFCNVFYFHLNDNNVRLCYVQLLLFTTLVLSTLKVFPKNQLSISIGQLLPKIVGFLCSIAAEM